MKKSQSKLMLGIVIVAASFVSFIYLNTTSAAFGKRANVPASERHYLESLEDQGRANPTLPDIHLIIEAVETAKRVIPAF